MPELIEQMYCSQQIVIPPKYPYILKRYCKAAIKTQPYDLLRWSFEYFKALADHRPPPVKLRLEYPIYSTEGGLTRGCLKVLAQQLSGMKEIPLNVVKQAWQGFCLDPTELQRILCLCEVYMRAESVPYLNFLAVAGGMLTKCLTHTMILLCESLTKEPDGGSAAIPVNDFLDMYMFLGHMDASQDVKYYNGYREGDSPAAEEAVEEEELTIETDQKEDQRNKVVDFGSDDDDYWEDGSVQKLALINDHVARSARLSVKMNLPVIGKIERSPSIERAREIERETYMRERKGRAEPSEEVDERLKQLSVNRISSTTDTSSALVKDDKTKAQDEKVEKKEVVEIFVFDEDENPVEFEIYGEPKENVEEEEEAVGESATQATLATTSVSAKQSSVSAKQSSVSAKQSSVSAKQSTESKNAEEQLKEEEETEYDKLALFLAGIFQQREERLNDIEQTFDDIAIIVDKFKTASYDLGMVAGRQMSTTSGEFIVQHIEKEILEYIDEQIAILPDPDLKKKKAKPEEVAMIRDLLEQFIDDNMDIIVPEIEEVEEEETPMPEITTVYAVPGIGPPVNIEIMSEFEDYTVEVSKIQGDMFMPRNIRHFLCPPLEKYVEHKYDDSETKKEEVATGGVITE